MRRTPSTLFQVPGITDVISGVVVPRRGGIMLKLADYDNFEYGPEPLPFPTEAERALLKATDTGTCAAARRVENALRHVELNFERLRDLMGFNPEDPDRPRAA